MSHVGVLGARHRCSGCHQGALPALHPAELSGGKWRAWHAHRQACAALEVPCLPWTHAEFSLCPMVRTFLFYCKNSHKSLSTIWYSVYSIASCTIPSPSGSGLLMWKDQAHIVVDFLSFLFSKRKQPNLIQTYVWEPRTHERVRLHMRRGT